MNNLSLETTLAALVHEAGYDCICCDAKQALRMLPPFPSAWLEHPALHSVDSPQRTSYDVVLRLFAAAADLDPMQRRQKLERLEGDMLTIFSRLSNDSGVIAVENLTVTPAVFSLTNRGEVSQTAKARIITWH